MMSLGILCRAQSPPPCKNTGDKNGSALCMQLKVEKGRIAIASYRFAPNGNYENRRSLADDLIAEAKLEIAKLIKPCAYTMSARQLKSYQQNPSADPDAVRICGGDFAWVHFRTELLRWGAAIGRRSKAIDAIQENGIFRPLVKLKQRSPLLWIENANDSLNVEAGVMTLLVADPVDPRNGNLFPIIIDGLPDGPVKQERLARLRKWLNPLRNSVFCHDRIRAAVTSFYTSIGVSAEIVALDPQGPLLQILERNP